MFIDMRVNEERILRELERACQENEFLRLFDRELKLQNQSFNSRISKIRFLKRLSKELNKNFDKINSEDLKEYFSNKNYSENSLNSFYVSCYQFFKFIKRPEVIDWISFKKSVRSQKLPEILDIEEIKNMISATDNIKDKCLICVLYEAGLRIGELCNIKIKDVTFDDYGVIIIVSGKTGVRRLRLKDSEPFIRMWINNHPTKENRDSYLFLSQSRNRYGQQYKSQNGISSMLKLTAKRAGIKKNVHAHKFRHSRATELAKFMTEQELKIFFGWVGSSSMTEKYVHLSGGHLDKKMLEIYGIRKEEIKQQNREMSSQKCSRCEEINSFDNLFCFKCSMPLKKQSIDIKEQIIEKSIDDGTPLTQERVVDLVFQILNQNKK